MENSAFYIGHAEGCRRLAANVDDADLARDIEGLAKAYDALAELAATESAHKPATESAHKLN